MTNTIPRMSEKDAAFVAAYAKDLFRYVTPAQLEAVRDLMRRLPAYTGIDGRTPVNVGEGLLRVVAARSGAENRLNPADVAKEVDAELARQGVPVERRELGSTVAYHRQREAIDKFAAYWRTVDEWAESLSDAEADDWTAFAIVNLPDDATRKFFLDRKRTVKNSRPLRGTAYDYQHAQEVFR